MVVNRMKNKPPGRLVFINITRMFKLFRVFIGYLRFDLYVLAAMFRDILNQRLSVLVQYRDEL